MTLQIKSERRETDGKQLALEEAAREETTRLNILIPETLHRALRLHVADEGKGATISALVTDVLRDYFDGQHAERL